MKYEEKVDFALQEFDENDQELSGFLPTADANGNNPIPDGAYIVNVRFLACSDFHRWHNFPGSKTHYYARLAVEIVSGDDGGPTKEQGRAFVEIVSTIRSRTQRSESERLINAIGLGYRLRGVFITGHVLKSVLDMALSSTSNRCTAEIAVVPKRKEPGAIGNRVRNWRPLQFSPPLQDREVI